MRPANDPITKAAIGALLGLGLASLSAACVTELGAPSSDELGELDIVGGQEESGYPAVGALTPMAMSASRFDRFTMRGSATICTSSPGFSSQIAAQT